MQPIDLDSLKPTHLPDQPKSLPAWIYQSTSPLQLRNRLSKAYTLIQSSPISPSLQKRRSWPTDLWTSNPITPPPSSPKLDPSPAATTPPPPYLHPLHRKAASLHTEEPKTTSFDPKYAQQSLSLLQTALSEHAHNATFARLLYIHAIIYLLQGLPPPSTLTEVEKTSLGSAMPGYLMLAESVHDNKLETTANSTSHQHPKPSPSLLHRALSTTILLLVILAQFLTPYLLCFVSTLQYYEREYSIRVHVHSFLATLSKRSWDIVVSAADPQDLIRFVAEVSAGVADGWRRGMSR